jgi:hypothetical protein
MHVVNRPTTLPDLCISECGLAIQLPCTIVESEDLRKQIGHAVQGLTAALTTVIVYEGAVCIRGRDYVGRCGTI